MQPELIKSMHQTIFPEKKYKFQRFEVEKKQDFDLSTSVVITFGKIECILL